MTTRVFDTRDIKALNHLAVQQGFNRALADFTVSSLDPDGHHVVAMVFDHNDHLRVEIMFKMIFDTEPVRAFIDMTYDDFERYGVAIDTAALA